MKEGEEGKQIDRNKRKIRKKEGKEEGMKGR